MRTRPVSIPWHASCVSTYLPYSSSPTRPMADSGRLRSILARSIPTFGTQPPTLRLTLRMLDSIPGRGYSSIVLTRSVRILPASAMPLRSPVMM